MHKRSDFNKFIDGCPEWVQNEIWGDSGMLSKIEQQQALIEQQQQRIAELKDELNECKAYLIATQRGKDKLAATVERLRDYIERGSPYSTNPSKCERKAILAATPQQNLNAVKREVS